MENGKIKVAFFPFDIFRIKVGKICSLLDGGRAVYILVLSQWNYLSSTKKPNPIFCDHVGPIGTKTN